MRKWPKIGWVKVFTITHSCQLQEGPMYCVWEVKDGISESDFQEFIDGPEGVNMGMKSINNNLLKIDLELTGGQTPYERKFA